MKYMGSKNRLAKELVPIIQKYIDDNEIENYLEPFVGGCSIIEKIKCKNRYGSDNHKYLIAFLNKIKEGWIPKEFYSELEYKKIKNNIEKYPDYLVGYIGFCLSFGAKWFGGYAKSFKNDKITPRNHPKESFKNIKKQAPLLKDIIFNCCDFRDIKPIKNFVIYCDIPYKNTTKYSTSKDFPYEEFYDWCKKMSKDNIVLVSEYDMPDDFECIWTKETTTQIDSNRNANDDKNKRVEKLFIYRGDYLNGRKTSKM